MMGDWIEVELDERQWRELERLFAAFPRRLPTAVGRALNRAGRTMYRRVVQHVSRGYGVAQKRVRRRVWLSKATRSRLSTRVRGGEVGLPLGYARARQTPTGVTVRLGDRTVEIPHAFVATMPSGHRGVFVRRTRKRLPIVEQRGPSPSDLIRPEADRILAEGYDVFWDRIRHEADRLLEGR